MLIGIISDTHDNAQNLLKVFEYFNEKNVDLILHLGDWVSPFMLKFCKSSNFKIISIFGNNESKIERFSKKVVEFGVDVEFLGLRAELELDGKKFFLCHGDNLAELDSAISSGKYDVVLSGHNHLSSIKRMGNVVHINPGAVCGIKKMNVDHPVTAALYDTQVGEGEIIFF
jgi:uncharacterized protein